MPLNVEKLRDVLKEYKYRKEHIEDYPHLKIHDKIRKEHSDKLRSLTAEQLRVMSKEDYEENFSDSFIWSSSRRNTMKYYIEDNGIDKVRFVFSSIYEIADRNLTDAYMKHIKMKNLGFSWITEILSALNWDKHLVMNNIMVKGLNKFGFDLPSSFSINCYEDAIRYCSEIAVEMKKMGLEHSLFNVDGFINYYVTEWDADTKKSYWFYTPGEKASKSEKAEKRKIIGINWGELGDLNNYTSKSEIKKKMIEEDIGRKETSIWYFYGEMKTGDVVFIREGRNKIIGYAYVKSGYRYYKDDGLFIHQRKAEWHILNESVNTEFTMGKDTITSISKDDLIKELIEKCKIDIRGDPVEDTDILYSKDKFVEETLLSEDVYDDISSLLERKKNLILQGPPGVGKTFISKRIAYAMMRSKSDERIQYVQFHQNYSYDDFIYGYRPTEKGFEPKNGIFLDFCDKARNDLNNKYFFIIDEINRGNLSKIFGELLVLIESDKRYGQSESLTIKTVFRDEFSIPKNIYIIGMMNTADRSLALIDYALRRRFAFYTLKPMFTDENFVDNLQTKFDRDPEVARKIHDGMVSLNGMISNDPNLGPGFCIGHSFFFRNKEDDDPDCPDEYSDDDWYEDVVRFEILPLLEEYWFDEPKKVEDGVSKLGIRYRQDTDP